MWQDKAVEFPLLVLLCRCGAERFALPASNVTRVLGAVQFVSIVGLSGCAVGIVNVAGVNLPLCDSRIALGLVSAELLATDCFVELESAVHGTRRWLLWVEEISDIMTVSNGQCDLLEVADGAMVRHALRLPLETVRLLDLLAVEPDMVIGN